MVINCVVELRSEQHVDFVLNFLLNLLAIHIILLDIKRLRPDKMREEVLIPDQVVDLIADLAALGAAEVLAG